MFILLLRKATKCIPKYIFVMYFIIAMKEMFERLKRDDPQAWDLLHKELRARFFPGLLRDFRNRDDAEEAYSEGLYKLLRAVRKPTFTWQGEAQFYSFCHKVFRSAAADLRRRRRKHLVLPEDRVMTMPPVRAGSTDENDCSQAVREMMDVAEKVLTGHPRLIFCAYKALFSIPGSDSWPPHQRTQWLQKYTGLKGNAFYIAHSRMRKKLEEVLSPQGLLRGKR